MKKLVAALLAFLSVSACAASLAEEVPLNALHDQTAFSSWKGRFEPLFRQRIVNATPGALASSNITSAQQRTGYTLYTIATTHVAGYNMGTFADGGLLAVPDSVDPAKRLVIAIHGHEETTQGAYPSVLFDAGKWGLAMVQAGHIVWAPVSMSHAQFSHKTYALGGVGNGKGDVYGYIPIWAGMVNLGIDAMEGLMPNLQHSGYAVMGVSAGALVGYTLMAYRPDIEVGVFAGAQQPLDFYRREYPAMVHERCWDFPGLTSFTQIKALIAPRPIQFQLGQQDDWWPNQQPFPQPAVSWFPGGTSRDVLVDEIAGQLYLLQNIWATAGGGTVEQFLHAGDHEMVPAAAIQFIQQQ